LGCIAVFSGTPISLLGWAGVAVLGAGIPHFYTYRSGRLNFFAWLGILSLSGLPYSISSFALVGLGSASSWYWLPIGLLVYTLLFCNLVGNLQLPTVEKSSTERLFLVVYLFGLFLLALSPFAILVKNRALAANALKYWWLGGAILVIGLLFYWIRKRIHISENLLDKIKDRIIQFISFTTFSWLKNLWQGLVWIFSGMTQFINQLLNGEGGIIWAVVILALLVSLISVGRA